jgi:hypothetical protein
MESYINLELSQYPYLKETDLNLFVNCSGNKTIDDIKQFVVVLTENESSCRQEQRLKRVRMFMEQLIIEKKPMQLFHEIAKILQATYERKFHEDGGFRIVNNTQVTAASDSLIASVSESVFEAIRDTPNAHLLFPSVKKK